MSSVGPSLERTTVDGVPVLWAEGPEPFVGALVFRVGMVDETLAKLGRSHLVEHLALFAAGRRQFDVNGLVDESRTLFWAAGTREEACGYLSDVALALGSLPFDRLESERRVLLTEAQARAQHPFGALLRLRFGLAGFGLLDSAELGLHSLDAEEVSSWARERFTAGNAAVWLTGPPTDDFSLPLAGGARFSLPEATPMPRLRLPAHAEGGSGSVQLSFLASRSVAAGAAASLAGERADRDLRTHAGLSYAVGGSYWPLTVETAHVALVADCLDEHAVEVRSRMLAAVESLAADGPSEDELADCVGKIRRGFQDPRSVTGFLDSCAHDLLIGAPVLTRQEISQQVDALTPDAIGAVIREGLPTALLLAPDQTPPPGHGFVPHQEGWDQATPVDGVSYSLKGRRKVRFVAGEAGVSFVDGEKGTVVTIPDDEVVALVCAGSGRFALFSAADEVFRLTITNVKNGAELEETLRRRFADVIVSLEHQDKRPEVDRLAALKLKRRWTVSPELELLPDLLAPGEELVTMAEASRRMKGGLLVLTNRRLLFVFQGIRQSASELVELAYHEIEAVRASEGVPGVRGARVRVRTAGRELTFREIVPRHRAPELEQEIRARAGL